MSLSGTVVTVCGFSFGAYLLWSARATNRTLKREDNLTQHSHTLLTLAGAAFLLWNRLSTGPLALRFVPRDAGAEWTGVALCAVGFAFAAWARHHLGVYWSARVTLKEEHHIVSSGPYHYFRHPMYVGLVAAIAGIAIWEGRWSAMLGAVLFTLGLWRKSHIEERMLGSLRSGVAQEDSPRPQST
jgi:protein-S-isoprenylcysteine O-methyltransferase Ste14